MTVHQRPRPIGGRLLAPPMPILLAVFGASTLVMAYRFFAGIGAVSYMTDGFTWGIWEPINVVVFTGIGAGALGVGLLTYVLNRGEYHGLVRPAVLLGAICYTLGGSSIMVALGRYWVALLIPVVPFWNLGSALLEVAVCVLPTSSSSGSRSCRGLRAGGREPVLPRWAESAGVGGAARQGDALHHRPRGRPARHAPSSLGGLLLLAETKVHPLWHTALLPALFLVSCIAMGYGAVVALSTILEVGWRSPHDLGLLAKLSKANAGILFFYVALRAADVVGTASSASSRSTGSPPCSCRAAALPRARGAVPAPPRCGATGASCSGPRCWPSRPAPSTGLSTPTSRSTARGRAGSTSQSLGEITVTIGMAALGIALFILISRLFPIIVVAEGTAPQAARPTRAA